MSDMLPRRILPWLFALTLLFGQAAAFAHTLTHLHAQEPGLPDKVCEVCVAQTQLGAGAAPAPLVLAMPLAAYRIPSDVATLRVDLAPRPACARAPPAPSNA
jgi:hypothetical protein